MKIDAHQHFWQFDPVRDSWITDEMAVIRRDFMPQHLMAELQAGELDGCVAVQADQSEAETAFLLSLAEKNDFIRGVVGWLDLESPQLGEKLEEFARNKRLRGLRHIMQGQPSGFMLREGFMKGVASLQKFDLAYDILIYENQLEEAIQFINRLPEMRLVIDHIAKPQIALQGFDQWARGMEQVSHFPHVCVKISGMVTEADWNKWKPSDFDRYLDYCFEKFGPDRLMFGSDWPVCLVAATYADTLLLVTDYIQTLSSDEQFAVLGGTAARFYQLTTPDNGFAIKK